MDTKINCKYCQSENIKKYGTYKDNQYWFCNDCRHKFSGNTTIPAMQTPTDQIADALNMYYEGLSLAEIRRNLIQQHNNPISRISAYNWFERFTKIAVEQTKDYKPQVGGLWVADETVIDIDGKNVWFWDIIDIKTRFLLASHMSCTRTSEDAKILMDKALKMAGKSPRIIYTDKLRAYLEGIEQTFGGDTEHRQSSPFDVESGNNYIERFHGTLKERTKVMRGLRTMATAKRFLDGWLVHYNFFRPHMSLNDKTPAEMAGIKTNLHNWKDVVNQPYSITARIPIKTVIDIPKPTHKPVKAVKTVTKKRKKTVHRKRDNTPPTQQLSSMRLH